MDTHGPSNRTCLSAPGPMQLCGSAGLQMLVSTCAGIASTHVSLGDPTSCLGRSAKTVLPVIKRGGPGVVIAGGLGRVGFGLGVCTGSYLPDAAGHVKTHQHVAAVRMDTGEVFVNSGVSASGRAEQFKLDSAWKKEWFELRASSATTVDGVEKAAGEGVGKSGQEKIASSHCSSPIMILRLDSEGRLLFGLPRSRDGNDGWLGLRWWDVSCPLKSSQAHIRTSHIRDDISELHLYLYLSGSEPLHVKEDTEAPVVVLHNLHHPPRATKSAQSASILQVSAGDLTNTHE